MKPLHLDFHGRLSVTVEAAEARYLPARDVIASLYAAYARPAPAAAPASLHVRLGAFTPDLQGRHQVDGTFWIGDDKVYCAYRHKIARWRMEASGLQAAHSRLDISGNVFSYLVFPFETLHQMIFLKLGRAGLAPVHALGVCKEGKARLLIGRSGVGKSLLGGKFLRDGYALLGDDTVFLDAAGTVYGLHLPLGMRTMESSLRDYGLRLTAGDRMEFALKRIIKWATLGRIGLLFKVAAGRLPAARLAGRAGLETAFYAVPGEPFRLADPRDTEEFLDRVMLNVRFEAVLTIKLLDAYAYIHPSSPLARHWEDQRALFRAAFSRAALRTATLPSRLPDSAYADMRSALHA